MTSGTGVLWAIVLGGCHTVVPESPLDSTPTSLEQLAAACQGRLDAQVWDDGCLCSPRSAPAEAVIAACQAQARTMASAQEAPAGEPFYLDYAVQLGCPSPVAACVPVQQVRAKPQALLVEAQ